MLESRLHEPRPGTRFGQVQLKRAYLAFWAVAVALLAYVVLDYWQSRNAPPFKRFERQWAEDVRQMEESGKLPKPWFDVAEVEIIPGKPEAKVMLRQIHVPLAGKKKDGQHRLEVLVVPWEEEGKTGVMLQYNLTETKSKNMIYELGRTLILSEPEPKNPLQNLWQDLHK